MSVSIDHALVHVRDALATDARVSELGLDVTCEDEVVVVRGRVATSARQRAIAAVATEVLRDFGWDHLVRDETSVTETMVTHDRPEQL